MSSQLRTRKADFTVAGETYQTWYKVLGDVHEAGKTPLVLLHGGPGMSHHYMLPHEALFEKHSIPVVFYDQLGNGESSHIRDKPAAFWTPQIFMDELDNLLQHLGLYNHHFDLLGHSWGGESQIFASYPAHVDDLGMLAGQYAAERPPPGLRKLIIANAPASIPGFVAGTNHLLEQFPADIVQSIRKLEAGDNTSSNSQEYKKYAVQFQVKHVCAVDPWPQGLVDSFNAIAANPTVYHALFGPSEFNVINITGNLRDWSIVDVLHKVPCTTLLLSAPLDEVQECAFLPFFTKIPKVKWVEIPTGTHLAMYEDPVKYFDVILKFLD